METGEGRAKKSKNVSASEIYYMAEKQCFHLSYNQKLREKEREGNESERKLEQKERESESSKTSCSCYLAEVKQ